MGNLCLGSCNCCCNTPPIPQNYIGPLGIQAPVGLGFGSIQAGCCGCIASSGCCNGGCCAREPITPPPGAVGCGRFCSCCADNIPRYTNTYAPDPPVPSTATVFIPIEAQTVNYIYNQGPPTIIPASVPVQAPRANNLIIDSPIIPPPPPPLIRPVITSMPQGATGISPFNVNMRTLVGMRGISPVVANGMVGMRGMGGELRPLSPSPIMRNSPIPAIIQSNQPRVMAAPLTKFTTSIVKAGPLGVIQPCTPIAKTMSYDLDSGGY